LTNPNPNPKSNPITNLTLTITSALTRFNIKCEVVPQESEISLKVKS